MPTEAIDLSRAEWQTSSYSGGNGGQCVEVARNLPGIVAVRDSKRPEGSIVTIDRRGWTAFVTLVRASGLGTASGEAPR
jgi:hypothetical protein